MHSAIAVAGSLAAVYAAATVVTLATAAQIIGLPFLSIVKAFGPSATASAVMAVVVGGWAHWSRPLSPIVQVAGGVAIGGIAFLLALRVVDRQMFVWARAAVFGRSPAKSDEMLRTAAP